MKRRALLAGFLAASAGCMNEPGESVASTTDTTDTRTNGTTTADGNETTTADGNETTTDGSEQTASAYRPDWAMADEPRSTISVGSRDEVAFPESSKARSVALWNDTGGGVELGAVVTRGGVQVVDRTLSLADGEWVAVELREPDEYRVRALVDSEERWSRKYHPSSFDCNSRFTQVALGPDGAMRSRSGGTAEACQAPGVSGTELAVGDGDCASDPDHEASVAFRDETVVVDGGVLTPTPCYRLTEAAAGYGDYGTTLTLAIAAEPDGTGCVECEGNVPYTATVDLEAAYPDRFVVAHVVDGERTVVASVDR